MNLLFYGKMKTDLLLESTHDLSRSHIHPPEFGLKWLGNAYSDPVFLKDRRNSERFSSSEQWFCTSPAKSCPIWTRYAKDYLVGVRGSSSLMSFTEATYGTYGTKKGTTKGGTVHDRILNTQFSEKKVNRRLKTPKIIKYSTTDIKWIL